VTPTIKNRLDAEARANGRTQSQEAEARLERSFEKQDILPDALKLSYGDKTSALIRLLLEAISNIVNTVGWFTFCDRQNWVNEPFIFRQVLIASFLIMKSMKPPGDPSFPEERVRALTKNTKDLRLLETIANFYPNQREMIEVVLKSPVILDDLIASYEDIGKTTAMSLLNSLHEMNKLNNQQGSLPSEVAEGNWLASVWSDLGPIADRIPAMPPRKQGRVIAKPRRSRRRDNGSEKS